MTTDSNCLFLPSALSLNGMDEYQYLWQAVIRQQFADMANQNHKEDSEILRSQARHWLLNDRRDFAMVCEMAGWHPEKVRVYAQQMSKMYRVFHMT